MGGEVVALSAEEGKTVKKGEVLARLDDTEYRLKLMVAQAGLELPQPSGKGGNEQDAREGTAIARAKVELARAEVEQGRTLEGTIVRAPITGTVLTKHTEIGNLVHPLSHQLSTKICEMADLRHLEVDLSIPERDIGLVVKGQHCLIQLVAFPKDVYKGQVSRVLPVTEPGQGIAVRASEDRHPCGRHARAAGNDRCGSFAGQGRVNRRARREVRLAAFRRNANCAPEEAGPATSAKCG